MFDINKTDSMTSRGRENQLADEDEGKETNLKKKSEEERKKTVLKSSSLKREKKDCLPKN